MYVVSRTSTMGGDTLTCLRGNYTKKEWRDDDVEGRDGEWVSG